MRNIPNRGDQTNHKKKKQKQHHTKKKKWGVDKLNVDSAKGAEPC